MVNSNHIQRKACFYLTILFAASAVGFPICCSFNKVVIWGHKLHSHTHSYIHYAFFRAFKSLGYPTYWFDNNDNVSSFDFRKTLFITETQVDQKIPLRADCRYILHNCKHPKYHDLMARGRCVNLQIYSDYALTIPNIKKIDDCIYYDLADKCIYMPWATDLLPQEIEVIKRSIPKIKKQKRVWWIGSVGDGRYGNNSQLNPFRKACSENGISFQQKINVSPEENIQLIQESYMAPTLVGELQKQIGYIPCRIFKNISYGQIGITNSKRVYELFKRKIVYNPNPYKLFYDAQKRLQNLKQEELFELMDLVKEKHTYLNRVQVLLDFLKLVEETYGEK